MKRSSSGKFTPICRNIHHAEWKSRPTIESGFTVFSRLPLSQKSHFDFDESVSVKKGSKVYVCKDCVNHSKYLQGIVPSSTITETLARPQAQQDQAAAATPCLPSTSRAPAAPPPPAPPIDLQGRSTCKPDVQNLIETVLTLPQEDIAKIVHSIGKAQRKDIQTDISTNNLTCAPSVDTLLTYDSANWLKSRNSVLSSFLCGVSDCSPNSLGSNSYGICKAVEQVYFNVNPRCLLPHSFQETVLIYSVSKSKLLPDALGGVQPGGTYYRIRKWLEEQAAKELPSLKGDVVVAFDNDQVVGKTYHVKADNKVRVSVITSICAFEEDGTLQQDKDLKPSNWYHNRHDQFEEITDPKSEINRKASEIHYRELYKALSDAISVVVDEQKQNDNLDRFDIIDLKVQENAFQREYRLCPSCSERNRRNKRICAHCGERLRSAGRADREEDPCEESLSSKVHVDSEQSAAKTYRVAFGPESEKQGKNVNGANISARDPYFVNPNSAGSIAAVFRHIGKDANVRKYVSEEDDDSNLREWICVVCDGLPYSIALNILSDFYQCELCGEKVQGLTLFQEHMQTIHPGIKFEPRDHLEFGWLLLHIGHGHYEMNCVRSFFSLNWEIFVKDAAYVMGFKTERAQQYAKSGSDHHKAWELLQVMYHGGLRELLLPYVRKCLADQSNPSPEGYLRWSKEVEDRSYAYFQEQVLTYAQAIQNLRKGLRTNNADLVIAGRIKHAPIFHGRNHPKYQAIEVAELATFLGAPPSVQQYLARHSSYSASGDPIKGEDLDFILENLNKQSKDWIPRGVPTEYEWLRIFRNLDRLNEVRQETLRSMGHSTQSTSRGTSHNPSSSDIMAWRIFLREKGYLASPMTPKPITSTNGEELDSSLLDISRIGADRRRYFAAKVLHVLNEDTPKPDPVIVTKSERSNFDDIRKQTKERICSRIEVLITAVTDEDSRDILVKELAQVKSRRKDEVIGLFYRVKAMISEGIDSDSDASDD